MSHPMRFMVMVLPSGPWNEVLARYRHVEALGFDVAGIADHFVDWTKPENDWYDLWTVAAAVAQATDTVRIASCVAQIPVRDPGTCARHTLSLDHISNGRFELGLGLGLPIDPSYAMMGIDNWSNPERAARFPEYVELVDRMLSQEITDYEGKYYSVTGAHMNPRPVQSPRPPITIAALGPKMLGYTAKYADTWNTMSFAKTWDEQVVEIRKRVERITAECEALGRDPATLRFSANLFDPDARASGGRYACYESTDAFEERARQLMDIGMNEIGLYYPALAEQMPVFEEIASEVLPRLR